MSGSSQNMRKSFRAFARYCSIRVLVAFDTGSLKGGAPYNFSYPAFWKRRQIVGQDYSRQPHITALTSKIVIDLLSIACFLALFSSFFRR